MIECRHKKEIVFTCLSFIFVTFIFPSSTAHVTSPPGTPGTRLSAFLFGAVQIPTNKLAPDTLVLCPSAFAATLNPWVEYRQNQGHVIRVLSPASNPYSIKQQVRRVAEEGRLKHLLIIGDTPDYTRRKKSMAVPTDYIRAEVVAKYGSEPEIATDNTFADWNNDGRPDLAVGRIPVDTTQQLEQQIAKIIHYERHSQNHSTDDGGRWKRRINFVAGTGGFGVLQDQVIEKTSKRMITELIPPAYQTSVTYASWSSPYCPDPREFVDTTVKRLNEGCLFWVYMGHGHPHQLDYVRTPIAGFPIFRPRDLPRVNCKHGLPVALMLACYTCGFDMPRDCLAEQLLLRPGGPIAVVGGTRVTTPYGMSVLSLGIIQEYFYGKITTLGDLLLAAKCRLVSNEPQDGKTKLGETESKYRKTIDLLGKTLSPTANELTQELHEHLHLVHLIGDPLLRLPRPDQIQLETQQQARSGGRLVVTGNSPHPGRLLLELSYPRDRMQVRPPRRPDFPDDPVALTNFQKVYENANRQTCTQKMIPVGSGRFETEIEIPDWAKGRCLIRAFLVSENCYAMGSTEVRIKKR